MVGNTTFEVLRPWTMVFMWLENAHFWLIPSSSPEFRVTSSNPSPSMPCELGVIPECSRPVFRYFWSINCLKWADGDMDRQIYSQTMPGQTGKCILGVIGSYWASKVWVRTCVRTLLHEPGWLAGISSCLHRFNGIFHKIRGLAYRNCIR